MTVGPDVSGFIEGALSSLKTADVINLSQKVNIAEAMTRSAYGYAVPTPELDAAFAVATEAIQKFGRSANQSGTYSFTQDDFDNQCNAVVAVEHFGMVISRAQPNDLAKALGLG